MRTSYVCLWLSSFVRDCCVYARVVVPIVRMYVSCVKGENCIFRGINALGWLNSGTQVERTLYMPSKCSSGKEICLSFCKTAQSKGREKKKKENKHLSKRRKNKKNPGLHANVRSETRKETRNSQAKMHDFNQSMLNFRQFSFMCGFLKFSAYLTTYLR